MGRHQLRLLQFAIKFPGWNSYGTDVPTVRAVNKLVEAKLLEVNEHRQFRLITITQGEQR